MVFSSEGLANHAQKAFNEGWYFLYGAYGQLATEEVIQANFRQYPQNKAYADYVSPAIGKTRVSDCYGILKSYIWWQGEDENPKYDPFTDLSSRTAFAVARVKGLISKGMPEIPGIILFKSTGHAGVYMGNGEFIECVGFGIGMRKGTIENGVVVSGSQFLSWFEDTHISY
ncbi:MAG: hypothetical protein LBM16_03725 [Clostridiales bacterium]|jgi:hypothetical protein|nr:hypothetical protein [Clostridiales bacterium]